MAALLWILGIVLAIVAVGALLISVSKRRVEQLRVRAAAGDKAAQIELQRLESMQRAIERTSGKGDPDADRIVANGLQGRGTVRSVKRMGFSVKRGPEKLSSIDVELTCNLDGREPMDVTVNDLVAEPLIGRLLIGSTIPVRVDSSPPHRVVVLWDHA